MWKVRGLAKQLGVDLASVKGTGEPTKVSVRHNETEAWL